MRQIHGRLCSFHIDKFFILRVLRGSTKVSSYKFLFDSKAGNYLSCRKRSCFFLFLHLSIHLSVFWLFHPFIRPSLPLPLSPLSSVSVFFPSSLKIGSPDLFLLSPTWLMLSNWCFNIYLYNTFIFGRISLVKPA